jgi:response regulator RpfG family c-di-GMP phosphodiesterase
MPDSLPRILCVDDEPNLLSALYRMLSEDYDVTTARSAAEALAILGREPPFVVVVSDMRMPQMDGAAFLARVKEGWPDAVRILLTGQTDMSQAIAAINDGAIFRYLTKPCPQEDLRLALEAAIAKYRCEQNERNLLESTLAALVKTLTEILSVATPWAFHRSSIAVACVRHALPKLRWRNPWIYEVAASLSQVGCIGIPRDVLIRDAGRRPLTPSEAKLIAEHPDAACKLLSAIPRLEKAAQIVRYQTSIPPRGTDPEVERGAELLRAVLMLERNASLGQNGGGARQQLEAIYPALSDDVIAALADFRGAVSEMRIAFVAELRPGWVLEQDVYTNAGMLLLSKGHELTDTAILALRRQLACNAISEPIHVRCHASSRSAG